MDPARGQLDPRRFALDSGRFTLSSLRFELDSRRFPLDFNKIRALSDPITGQNGTLRLVARWFELDPSPFESEWD